MDRIILTSLTPHLLMVFWKVDVFKHKQYFSSAAFPNSKHAPPRKGDDDLNKRSNKLNGVQYFLKDSVRQMIEWKFEDFQDRFIQLGKCFKIGFLPPDDGHFTANACWDTFSNGLMKWPTTKRYLRSIPNGIRDERRVFFNHQRHRRETNRYRPCWNCSCFRKGVISIPTKFLKS